MIISVITGFPHGPAAKNPPANARDASSVPRLIRFPGEENGKPLQYSCLGNTMDGGNWQATVHGVAKNWTLLSDQTTTNSMSIIKAYSERVSCLLVVRQSQIRNTADFQTEAKEAGHVIA